MIAPLPVQDSRSKEFFERVDSDFTSSSQAISALPTFDLDMLTTLQDVLSPTAVRDFLLLYITDTASHLAYINQLNALSDIGGIAQEAHIIVGTAGNIGAAQVSALARVLENACRNHDHATVAHLVGKLNATSVVATDAIHDWLDSTASEVDTAAEART